MIKLGTINKPVHAGNLGQELFASIPEFTTTQMTELYGEVKVSRVEMMRDPKTGEVFLKGVGNFELTPTVQARAKAIFAVHEQADRKEL